MLSRSSQPYSRRVIDDELDDLMSGIAALAIEGPRAVGKTRTAIERAGTVHRLDEPGPRAVIEAEIERVLVGPRPVVIDEWQAVRGTWELVRRAVDDDRSPGQFILTGSANPRDQPLHTGAGRIVSLRMRPMTLAERGVAVPTVSLRTLLTGSLPRLDGKTDIGAERYAAELLASGFPGLRGLSERAVRAQLDGYVERVIAHDISELGGEEVRNEGSLRRWLRAYAAAVSTTASLEKIRDAATAGDDIKPTRPTVMRWIAALERLWLIEPIPAWMPTRNDLKRLAQSPKHQIADPALAARLRGATIDSLLSGTLAGPLAKPDTTLFGALFESQAGADLRTYAQSAEARVGHFRTRDGDREVDFIVERPDQRVVGVEVKLASVIDDNDTRHLRWLKERLGDDLLDAVVISTGSTAYRRADGIAVVPLALLGP